MTPIPPELEVKLERVKHHLVRLNKEIEDFFATQPYVITKEAQLAGKKHVAYITFTEPLPLSFAVRIGECLYQLRSVLDHTVRLLCPSLPDNSRDSEFVISNDRRRFYDGVDGRPPLVERLSTVENSDAQAFIEAVQPFNRRGGRPADHYLWTLHELFMADKHRRLLLTQAASHGSRAMLLYPNLIPYEAIFRRGSLNPGSKNRAKLATITLETAKPQVDVDFYPILTIAFDKREIAARNAFVEETLDNLWRFTAFIVGKLSEYIPQ